MKKITLLLFLVSFVSVAQHDETAVADHEKIG
jgi:hypothetical protein